MSRGEHSPSSRFNKLIAITTFIPAALGLAACENATATGSQSENNTADASVSVVQSSPDASEQLCYYVENPDGTVTTGGVLTREQIEARGQDIKNYISDLSECEAGADLKVNMFLTEAPELSFNVDKDILKDFYNMREPEKILACEKFYASTGKVDSRLNQRVGGNNVLGEPGVNMASLGGPEGELNEIMKRASVIDELANSKFEDYIQEAKKLAYCALDNSQGIYDYQTNTMDRNYEGNERIVPINLDNEVLMSATKTYIGEETGTPRSTRVLHFLDKSTGADFFVKIAQFDIVDNYTYGVNAIETSTIKIVDYSFQDKILNGLELNPIEKNEK